jgi:phage replication-related protein YjqB (UPF0714/DUF867 family)
MTDVIASAAAERADASLYAVVQPPDLRWHLPSTRFSPAVSPALARFVAHVDVAVALHGYGRHGRWTSLLLGGSNRGLAAHVGRALTAVDGHEVVTDLDGIPRELRGLHPDNPVNLPSRGGVQLELPPRVRGLTPHWAGWSGPGLAPPTEALVTALADAAASWPLDQGDSRSNTQPEAVAR